MIKIEGGSSSQTQAKQWRMLLVCKRNSKVVIVIDYDVMSLHATQEHEQVRVGYTKDLLIHCWKGEDWEELKLISHGHKLHKFEIHHPQIETMVLKMSCWHYSTLVIKPLIKISYQPMLKSGTTPIVSTTLLVRWPSL